MSRRSYAKDTLKFLFIAVVLMVCLHVFVMGNGDDPASRKTKELWEQTSGGSVDTAALDDVVPESGYSGAETEAENGYIEVAGADGEMLIIREVDSFDEIVAEEEARGGDDELLLGKYIVLQSTAPEQEPLMSLPSPSDAGGLGQGAAAGPLPSDIENVVARVVAKDTKKVKKNVSDHKTHYAGKPKIIVIIDDMGMSEERTQEVVALPGPLTLAFLPYAEGVREQAAFAKGAGHELIIHTPMEPMNGDLDMGPIALRVGMEHDAFDTILREQVLTSFDGYVGINNHMGSRLTQDAQSMGWVMDVLQEKGLFFVDSKTISTSVAADTARGREVPYAERDVFLDHYEDIESVYAALGQLERTARRDSYAIAIGHPKVHTIEALQTWLPTLEAKGFDLVPVSQVLERPWEKSSGEKLVDARGKDVAEPVN